MPSNPFAFPCVFELDANEQRGMELRDYFAAQALNGLLLHYHEDRGIGPNPLRELASLSYEYADAMLAAREKATT
jgi:hypothetical protein